MRELSAGAERCVFILSSLLIVMAKLDWVFVVFVPRVKGSKFFFVQHHPSSVIEEEIFLFFIFCLCNFPSVL